MWFDKNQVEHPQHKSKYEWIVTIWQTWCHISFSWIIPHWILFERTRLDQQSLLVLDGMLTKDETDCVPIYKNIFESVVEEKHLSSPGTLNEAADLLVLILDTVEEEMEQL